MTPEGGHGWEEDTLVGPGPDTVRPPPAASGVWEVVPPTRGWLDEDGFLWPCEPGLPEPGEISGPALYGAG